MVPKSKSSNTKEAPGHKTCEDRLTLQLCGMLLVIYEKTVCVGFGTMVSSIHWASWNISPVDKQRGLYQKYYIHCIL